MTKQIKPEQFICFLLNKTKSNCSLWSKTNNQNQIKMMTNDFCNPLTTVPTDLHPDVLESIIDYHTYSILLAQAHIRHTNTMRFINILMQLNLY